MQLPCACSRATSAQTTTDDGHATSACHNTGSGSNAAATAAPGAAGAACCVAVLGMRGEPSMHARLVLLDTTWFPEVSLLRGLAAWCTARGAVVGCGNAWRRRLLAAVHAYVWPAGLRHCGLLRPPSTRRPSDCATYTCFYWCSAAGGHAPDGAKQAISERMRRTLAQRHADLSVPAMCTQAAHGLDERGAASSTRWPFMRDRRTTNFSMEHFCVGRAHTYIEE